MTFSVVYAQQNLNREVLQGTKQRSGDCFLFGWMSIKIIIPILDWTPWLPSAISAANRKRLLVLVCRVKTIPKQILIDLDSSLFFRLPTNSISKDRVSLDKNIFDLSHERPNTHVYDHLQPHYTFKAKNWKMLLKAWDNSPEACSESNFEILKRRY